LELEEEEGLRHASPIIPDWSDGTRFIIALPILTNFSLATIAGILLITCCDKSAVAKNYSI
jgi:hypothetical protein